DRLQRVREGSPHSFKKADLQRTLDEMELSMGISSAKCPYSGAVHIASGFSELIAFRCEQCGEVVKLRDDPTWTGSSDERTCRGSIDCPRDLEPQIRTNHT